MTNAGLPPRRRLRPRIHEDPAAIKRPSGRRIERRAREQEAGYRRHRAGESGVNLLRVARRHRHYNQSRLAASGLRRLYQLSAGCGRADIGIGEPQLIFLPTRMAHCLTRYESTRHFSRLPAAPSSRRPTARCRPDCRFRCRRSGRQRQVVEAGRSVGKAIGEGGAVCARAPANPRNPFDRAG
jgi:hypothetical protein